VQVKSSRASLGRGLVAATSPKKKQLIKDIFGSDDEQEEPKVVVVPSPVKDEKQSQEGEVGWPQEMLCIHDILVRIRIRVWIRGSMPLTNGSGSCYFRHLLIEGTLTSFFKEKSQKEVTKQ
jgi:hypothetical protein